MPKGIYKRTQRHLDIIRDRAKNQTRNKKISVAHKLSGLKPPPRTGIFVTEKTRQKLRDSHSGEKSYLWRGGRTLLRKQIRECFKYRLWRSDVFARDGYSCQHCGAKSGNGRAVYLNADHFPKSFDAILTEYKIMTIDEALVCEELWNINNGRSLCRNCHQKTENWGRPKTWIRKRKTIRI